MTANVREHIPCALQQGFNPPIPRGLHIGFPQLVAASIVANNHHPFDLIFATQTMLAHQGELKAARNLLLPAYRCLSDGRTGTPLPRMPFVLVRMRLDPGGVLLPVNHLVTLPLFQPIIAESRLFVYSCLGGRLDNNNVPAPAHHHGGPPAACSLESSGGSRPRMPQCERDYFPRPNTRAAKLCFAPLRFLCNEPSRPTRRSSVPSTLLSRCVLLNTKTGLARETSLCGCGGPRRGSQPT